MLNEVHRCAEGSQVSCPDLAGGGPFYVPAMNVGLGFDLKLCTGLSHSIVAVGAIGSVLYGLVQPSPVDSGTTLLNFDIALTLIPAMLFGVSFGVPAHTQFVVFMCPTELLMMTLTVLLSVNDERYPLYLMGSVISCLVHCVDANQIFSRCSCA